MIGEPAFPLVESLPSESDRVVVAPELYEDSEDDVLGSQIWANPQTLVLKMAQRWC